MKNKAGMERILTAKLNYLAEHTNHELFLLTYEQEGCPLAFSLNNSVQYISINNNMPQRKDYSLLTWFKKYIIARNKFTQIFKETLKEKKPDIIVCNVYSFTIIDIIIQISYSKGIKTIIESHTKLSTTFLSHKFRYNKLLYIIIKKWDSLILKRVRRASYVVALTDQDVEDWKPYVKNIAVIPNFITIAPKTVTDYSAKRVISAGRYSYEKGYDMLLEAWSTIIKDYPDWQLHIYGDGDRKPYIQQSEQLDISNSVFLHPSTSDIAEEYSKSSIYVMSSRYEGFGLVLIEAMSCGLPCVAFDCPYGPRNIIRDKKDGILVPYEDIEKLVHCTTLLMANSLTRKSYGLKALEDIGRYNKKAIMAQWMDLFNNLEH